jgi:RNHCP domain
LSDTYRDRTEARRRFGRSEMFRCRKCSAMIGPTVGGGRHRNHCPLCLHSRHVDLATPGDRASACGGTMAPIGAFVRLKGEHAIVHRCLACGVERHNRIAADDDFELVLSLPVLAPRLTIRRSRMPEYEETA